MYVNVDARFKFFNGIKRYTVEYCVGLRKWFVFDGEKSTDALFQKEDKKIKPKNVNPESATAVFWEYLDTIGEDY